MIGGFLNFYLFGSLFGPKSLQLVWSCSLTKVPGFYMEFYVGDRWAVLKNIESNARGLFGMHHLGLMAALWHHLQHVCFWWFCNSKSFCMLELDIKWVRMYFNSGLWGQSTDQPIRAIFKCVPYILIAQKMQMDWYCKITSLIRNILLLRTL